MMMTSGEAVKYKGSMDCAVQIMKNEGFMSMMKGAGKYSYASLCSVFDRIAVGFVRSHITL